VRESLKREERKGFSCRLAGSVDSLLNLAVRRMRRDLIDWEMRTWVTRMPT